ncbi:MAG: hypothetical protein RBT42_12285 [Aquabacterium sp.]|jgi:hypothetical protein|uniref:hypothetical protein n=1 Tax=Aquabacterium sp. TaxID=1872578 RepID=UPI002A3612C7|nr:hypothetical protein [Aquabacterium sp.]MDX9844524.1 hypothetical protein [Aquabacterium sp.]
MAPQLRSVSNPHRALAWAVAVLSLSLCTASWSASEAQAERKARKRTAARTAVSTDVRPSPAPARATPLHVCQNAQGRTEYRQHPCPDGGRALIGHDDARVASQVRHSATMAQRDKKLLNTMTRDRQRQERLDVQARTPAPTERAPRPRQKAKEKNAADENRSDRTRSVKREPAWPRYRSLTPLTAEPTQERAKL